MEKTIDFDFFDASNENPIFYSEFPTARVFTVNCINFFEFLLCSLSSRFS